MKRERERRGKGASGRRLTVDDTHPHTYTQHPKKLDLDLLLRTAGVTNLVLAGITTDVCVHTTMRDANDRGYEVLMLRDCCAATDAGNHDAAISMVLKQGGVFGAVAAADEFVAAIDRD